MRKGGLSLIASLLTSLLSLLVSHSAMAQRPLGTDVSGHQPDHINWGTATNGGVRFAWSKATEGTGFTSGGFAPQMADAVNARVYIGAYHYARPGLHRGDSGADAEAAYFWSVAGPYIKNGSYYLMPMLDWEDVGTSGQPATDPTVANGYTTAEMSQWVNRWCLTLSNTAFANGVIVNPVVYSGTWYSVPGSTYPGLNSSVTNHPNCMSTYSGNPQTGTPATSPWPSWTFWQYADTNWTAGDSDVYNGTMASLLSKFVIGGTNAPSISLQPTNLTLGLGSNATFSVRASGQAPLTFQWQFNGANIAGATSSNCPVSGIQFSNAGRYTVILSNSYAIVPSSPAFLSVVGPLTNGAGSSVVAPTGMVDWWPADGNPKDIVGTVTPVPQGGFSYTSGFAGQAFNFDGSSSYLSTGAASIAVPWTACMWVKRQNAPGTAAAMLGDGTYELKLEQYDTVSKGNSHRVGFTHFGVADYGFNYIAPAGVWTHLAFVGTASATSLYVNGAFNATTNITMPLPRGYIGAGFWGVSSPNFFLDYMSGGLDEIMLFNRALSASEISSVYSAGSAGLVRAPILVDSSSPSPGQFALHLKGETGKTLSIYTSQDLVTWTKLTTVSNPSGTLVFTDTQATNSAEYYRVAQP
jgi:GH25 family lysozyme M1 (1,4-beta-N-acetylmuramidase)